MKWLKDHFIPHTGNEYHPHLLRPKATLLIAILVLFLEFGFLFQTSLSGPVEKFFALVLPNVLVDQTNVTRLAENIGALQTSPLLERAAIAKANDMARKGYFAHTSPEGRDPWYWFKDAGYAYSYAGENLAINFVDSRDVIDAWLASPKHRANLLNGKYTEIGIATAEGTYEGRSAVFVVQLFGRPSAKKFTPQITQVSPPQVAVVIPPTTTSSVLGMNGEKIAREEVVAVKGAEVEEPSYDVSGSTVTATPSYASISEVVVANPKKTMEIAFLVLAGILLAALFIALVSGVHLAHPALVVNSVLLLILLGGFFIANDYITLAFASVL